MYGSGNDNDKLYLFSYYVEYFDEFKNEKRVVQVKEDWQVERIE
jgi:hypothetical protein